MTHDSMEHLQREVVRERERHAQGDHAEGDGDRVTLA